MAFVAGPEAGNGSLTALNLEPPHTGVYLQARLEGSDQLLQDYTEKVGGTYEPPQHVKDFYEKQARSGQLSYTDRTIKIYLEGTDESLAIGAKVSTTAREVAETLSWFLSRDANSINIKRKTAMGLKIQRPQDEVASSIVISAPDIKSFVRTPHEFKHTILIVGCGLGGIQAAMDLQLKGREDFVLMDRNHDFGGHSWIKVPNKFTKLQTERGTYNVDYILPDAPVPTTVAGQTYDTWPSRDTLLAMMREGAKRHGLYAHAYLNTHIERVMPKKGAYAIQYLPVNEDDGDANIMLAGAVVCYPGFLHDPNRVEFTGEEEFCGYMEYSSFDNIDYELVIGKKVVLYGHGAFTIENVRTLVEHRIKQVHVVCRTRNLSGTKITSWLIGSVENSIPALVLLDSFKRMYDLIGYDVWSCYSVKADHDRTSASIDQKTIFGVTDIYFLAGYYDLMVVVEDTIKRVSRHCVHLAKTAQKLECEVLIKAVGTLPSFKVDKEMGIKEVRGFWVNGDPMRPIMMGAKGVQAKNFGSFSVGPGLAPTVKILNWFLQFPEDWWAVRDHLPTNKAGVWPAFVAAASYSLPVFMALHSCLPGLAEQCMEADQIKAKKQREAHPMDEYLAECAEEWETYIRFFKKHNMVDDRPDPPYPYTEEIIWGLVEKAEAIARGEKRYAD